MSLHHRHHSSAEMKYNSGKEPVDYGFSRNATMRASTGNLKQPRLPGSEKFRFSQSGATKGHQQVIVARSSTLPSMRKSQRINSCINGTLSSYAFSDSKRKPILPISKNTSRVLNNTNVELSADTVEFIQQETMQLSKICQKYISDSAEPTDEGTSDEWSRSSSDQSLEREGRIFRHSTVVIPHEHRSSHAGKSGSFKPGELELNNNQNQFASIRSNRLRMRSNRFASSSASQSTISSDDDIWVLRPANTLH